MNNVAVQIHREFSNKICLITRDVAGHVSDFIFENVYWELRERLTWKYNLEDNFVEDRKTHLEAPLSDS